MAGFKTTLMLDNKTTLVHHLKTEEVQHPRSTLELILEMVNKVRTARAKISTTDPASTIITTVDSIETLV
jgi:hypothetical protein